MGWDDADDPWESADRARVDHRPYGRGRRDGGGLGGERRHGGGAGGAASGEESDDAWSGASTASAGAASAASTSTAASAASTPDAAAGDGGVFLTHTVNKLDTLAGLAIKYQVTVTDIKRCNGLLSDNALFARTTIKIPKGGFQAGMQQHAKKPAKATPALEALRGFYGLPDEAATTASAAGERARAGTEPGPRHGDLEMGPMPPPGKTELIRERRETVAGAGDKLKRRTTDEAGPSSSWALEEPMAFVAREAPLLEAPSQPSTLPRPGSVKMVGSMGGAPPRPPGGGAGSSSVASAMSQMRDSLVTKLRKTSLSGSGSAPDLSALPPARKTGKKD